MRFVLDPNLMGVIHNQFLESNAQTKTILAVLKAQELTRVVVREIVHHISSNASNAVRRYYEQ